MRWIVRLMTLMPAIWMAVLPFYALHWFQKGGCIEVDHYCAQQAQGELLHMRNFFLWLTSPVAGLPVFSQFRAWWLREWDHSLDGWYVNIHYSRTNPIDSGAFWVVLLSFWLVVLVVQIMEASVVSLLFDRGLPRRVAAVATRAASSASWPLVGIVAVVILLIALVFG